MKTLVIAMAAVMAGSCFAAPAQKKALTPEQVERREKQRENFLRTTGGILYDERSGVGKIAVIDAQKSVSGDFVAQRVAKIRQSIAIAVVYSKVQKPVDLSNLASLVAEAKGNLSVVLVENPSFPALVSLPEQKCVVVNVSALLKDKPSEEKARSRVAKELSRAVCFAFVIPYGNAAGSVMDPVASMADLDKILVEDILVAQRAHIDRASARFGIKTFKRASYRDACQQGWAPAPSNDYQRAIWKEVHEPPSAPIKIEK